MTHDINYYYTLLSEGRLNLMYLPSGAVAWLWDQPDNQISAAEQFAVAAKDINPITDARLLRSDNNVLILACENGLKFRIYPDGGFSHKGTPMDLNGCISALQNAEDMAPSDDCPCGCGGSCGCGDGTLDPETGEEYEDSDTDTVQAVGDFVTYTVSMADEDPFFDEGIGGESDLTPRHGMGTGSPYGPVAANVIDDTEVFDPNDYLDDFENRDYNPDELEEISRAMGTYEGVYEGITLDESRLSIDQLEKYIKRKKL